MGIAPSVVPFVVPAADFVAYLNERLVASERNILKHLRTLYGVQLHYFVLFPSKLTGFIQYFRRNDDFTHVVQGRGVAD